MPRQVVAASDQQHIGREFPLPVSLYLDIVRFLAALCVFITHAKYSRFTSGWLDAIGKYGSDAVMIFFVLSGLVIAHTTRTKERELKSYVVARMARLWSVALPALFISFLADAIGQKIYPSMYDGPWYQGDHALLRILVNAVFMGQSWFADTLPFTNTPYWSLGYEFSYYAIFAAVHFLAGPGRWLAIGICFLISGPKILLLLPVWLLGVGVYHLAQTQETPEALGWLLWLGSFIGYALFQSLGLPGYLLWRTVQWLGDGLVVGQLVWSKDFIANYVVGILVAANFVGFYRVSHRFDAPLRQLRKPIRYLAGFTFSVYLFHMPLLHFFGALIHHKPANVANETLLLAATLAGTFLLGLVTEQKKSVAKRWILLCFRRNNKREPLQFRHSNDD